MSSIERYSWRAHVAGVAAVVCLSCAPAADEPRPKPTREPATLGPLVGPDAVFRGDIVTCAASVDGASDCTWRLGESAPTSLDISGSEVIVTTSVAETSDLVVECVGGNGEALVQRKQIVADYSVPELDVFGGAFIHIDGPSPPDCTADSVPVFEGDTTAPPMMHTSAGGVGFENVFSSRRYTFHCASRGVVATSPEVTHWFAPNVEATGELIDADTLVVTWRVFGFVPCEFDDVAVPMEGSREVPAGDGSETHGVRCSTGGPDPQTTVGNVRVFWGDVLPETSLIPPDFVAGSVLQPLSGEVYGFSGNLTALVVSGDVVVPPEPTATPGWRFAFSGRRIGGAIIIEDHPTIAEFIVESILTIGGEFESIGRISIARNPLLTYVFLGAPTQGILADVTITDNATLGRLLLRPNLAVHGDLDIAHNPALTEISTILFPDETADRVDGTFTLRDNDALQSLAGLVLTAGAVTIEGNALLSCSEIEPIACSAPAPSRSISDNLEPSCDLLCP